MSRQIRRLLLLLLPLLVVAGAATACGKDSSSASSPLDAVTISGKAGTEPTVTWKSQMTVTKVEATVLEKGDGDVVGDGDTASVQVWIGNGFTKKQALSTWSDAGPQQVTVDDKLSPVFAKGIKGQTIGSRVALTATGEDVWGPSGNPDLGIGNKDAVLIILDLLAPPPPVTPKDVPSDQLPDLVIRKGEPVALDFTGLPEPKADGDLLRSVVKEGDGAVVTKDMTVTADYLGQVYGADKPFDESYSKDPVPFPLSSVIKGWTDGLAGLTVGSRVILQIPPDLGYGSQEQSNIPANSTLYFVVDIIKAE